MADGRLTLAAVLFDVDFTLAKPGPELGPEGYRRAGSAGLTLDPARYDEARIAALDSLRRTPSSRTTTRSGSRSRSGSSAAWAGAGTRRVGSPRRSREAGRSHDNFELYEDVHPVLEELRRHGLRIGLVSNTARDLPAFVAHHALDVDAAISSGAHGRVKPHRSIFEAMLRELDVMPSRAAMVGDSPRDDIEGARALGMRAFLVDRDGRYREAEALPDLLALPAALGLPRPG